ncbi:MAG: ABC transporter ATP-binding protein [Alphaproteobacteria bacterium]
MITVEHVSKQYRIYRRQSDRLYELLLRRKLHDVKVAVSDIDFTLEAGQVLGVIGRNGAGKSTLLKLVMGVILPDQGSIRLSGRVTGLLELGTGFNPELTGYENIAFNAALLGMTPDEVAQRRQTIVDFSELGAVIQHPMRTYSSGMIMRLAFSIAIHANPSCLVVDEALAVGDAHFQQKCMQRIKEFRDNGGAILFVSHDMNAVKVLCDRAIVLEEGTPVFSGTPDAAVNYYNRLIASMENGAIAPPAPAEASTANIRPKESSSYGTGIVCIEGARVVGQGSGGQIISSGETADFVFDLAAIEAAQDVTLGIMIRDRLGQDIFGTNTFYLRRPITFMSGEKRSVAIRMAVNLSPGRYAVTAALHNGENHLTQCYHWCDNLLDFEVAGYTGPHFVGICRLEPSVHIVSGPQE